MEYVKQNMNQVWASAGDVVMPDNGKIQEGWLVEVPPRQYWNWMQNRTDTNLAYIFQRGIPEWDANVEYLANKSFVVYNGVTYKCIQTGTNQNPSTETAYWSRAFSTWSAAGEAVGGLTPSANTYAYFTGPSSAALGTITSFARSILDDATAGDVRTTIGAQQADATLTAIADLTTAANKLPYFTGTDTAALTDLTAFGRSLIDDNTAGDARTTLGVYSTTEVDSAISASAATKQPLDATLTAVAGVTTAANKLIYFTSVDAAAATDLSAFARTLLDDADAPTVRTTIGLGNVDNTSDANKPISTATQTALNAKLNLSGGVITGQLAVSARIVATGNGNDYAGSGVELVGDGAANNVYPTLGFHQPAMYAASLQLRGGNDFRFYQQGSTTYANVTASQFNGSLNGNATSATTLAGDWSNWASYRSLAVANMLGWRSFGNNHVIFDASTGTTPNGVAKSNTYPEVDWQPSHPTLMGWNGTNTYGVRVQRATTAENLIDSGWITLSLYNGFSHASDTLQIRRLANMVFMQGRIYRATPPGGLLEVTTIPSGYRPAKHVDVVCTMTADNFNWNMAAISVATTGSVATGIIGNPSQNNAYWVINTCWITDYA